MFCLLIYTSLVLPSYAQFTRSTLLYTLHSFYLAIHTSLFLPYYTHYTRSALLYTLHSFYLAIHTHTSLAIHTCYTHLLYTLHSLCLAIHTMSACMRSFLASSSMTAFANAFLFLASACLTPSVITQYGPITMLEGSSFSSFSLSFKCRSISCFTSAAVCSWAS